ncbi:unnamed protein product [Pylaiella littoralis]
MGFLATATAVAAVACAVLLPSGARAVSAGTSHSCTVIDDGTVKSIKCWGQNSFGQLGQESGAPVGGEVGDMGDNLDAVPLGGVSFEPAAVSSGNNFNCALSVDGVVKCWGHNNVGQLGQGDTDNRGGPNDGVFEMGDNLLPVDVLGVNSNGLAVESVSTGGSSACALLTGGLLKCWGWGEGGQLGLEDMLNRGDDANEMGDNLEFVDLGTGVTVLQVALGARHGCAVIEDGLVKCWGNNNGGQLGYEDRVARGTVPGSMGDNLPVVDLGVDQRVIAVEAGFYHTCALLYVGDVKCWGFGESGQLGQGNSDSIGDAQGTMGDDLPPIDLGTGRTAVALGLGGTHTCAVLDDETVKCWGSNAYGSLGLGDLIPRGIALDQMGDALPALGLTFGEGLGAVSNVFAGTLHTCVSGTEGGLACFGLNADGELGAETLEDLGDDLGETEGLTSISLGELVDVVAPASPGSTFDSSGTVAPGGSTPAPVGVAEVASVQDEDGPATTIAIATAGLVALIAFVAAACYYYRRQESKLKEHQRWQQQQQQTNPERGRSSAVADARTAGAKWDEETKSDGMPRPDNSRRVQFDSNANSDGDIHPLLKGVCLDATAPGEAAPTAQVTAEPPGDGLSSIAAGATGVSDPALPNSSPAEAKSSDKGTGARR